MTGVESGVWSAPGRVNLIGEHTDYNGGFALPMAIPQRTRVSARVLPANAAPVIRAHSTGHPEAVFGVDTTPGEVSGWAAYVAGTVWALRELGVPIRPAELDITTTVPTGAGLSSSAALECAVACAVVGLAGVTVDRTDLARAARRAENDYVGAPTGGMDQIACMYGAPGRAVFLDTASEAIEPVPFDLAAAGLELLVIDTRAPHRHADGEYGARRASCEQAARHLGVTSLREVQDGDHAAVLAKLDVAASAATAAGALGARMTGGGFGGAVIALVPTDVSGTVESAVHAAFTEHGFTRPAVSRVVPAMGAGPLDAVDSTTT